MSLGKVTRIRRSLQPVYIDNFFLQFSKYSYRLTWQRDQVIVKSKSCIEGSINYTLPRFVDISQCEFIIYIILRIFYNIYYFCHTWLPYSNTLVVIFTIRRGVPSSLYTIFEHVNLLKYSIFFKNPKCNYYFEKNILQPYIIMGTNVWFKSVRKTSIGGNRDLVLQSRETIALLPISYISCLCLVNFPL